MSFFLCYFDSFSGHSQLQMKRDKNFLALQKRIYRIPLLIADIRP